MQMGELLLELGFERSEVRLAKRAGLSGAALLAWDRGLLQERLFMPRSKVRATSFFGGHRSLLAVMCGAT